jgi:methylase of polypeptide subunit release factors
MSTQSCTFGPLRVEFDDEVLAPRPWTLLQSAHAARLLVAAPPGPIVEVHCGAGHIGQATAAWTGRPLVQLDDAAASCAWSAHNAHANAIASTVVRGDVSAAPLRDGTCALLLADPPYVPSAETGRYSEDPLHAIDGGDDGLDGIRSCLPFASRLLRRGGALVLQVRGRSQAARVVGLVDDDHSELTVVDIVEASPTRAVVELVRG